MDHALAEPMMACWGCFPYGVGCTAEIPLSYTCSYRHACSKYPDAKSLFCSSWSSDAECSMPCARVGQRSVRIQARQVIELVQRKARSAKSRCKAKGNLQTKLRESPVAFLDRRGTLATKSERRVREAPFQGDTKAKPKSLRFRQRLLLRLLRSWQNLGFHSRRCLEPPAKSQSLLEVHTFAQGTSPYWQAVRFGG